MLSGTVIRYGEVARDRPEMFQPGSFVSGLDRAALNLQHDQGTKVAEQPDRLTFTDSPEALHLRARLRRDSAEVRLVERRALRGLSVEFVALSESARGGLRVIEKAHLHGVGLVDQGSYAGSEVELRQLGGWLDGLIPANREVACECQGDDVCFVEFLDGAFDETLASADEILAVSGGGFNRVLGSKRRGSLLLEATDEGLEVGLTEVTPAARDVIESSRAAPFYARPILDDAASESVIEGRTRKFSKATIRAILVKPTVNSEGLTPVTILGEARQKKRRRRIWL